MKLFKLVYSHDGDQWPHTAAAELSDIKAALAEHGYKAVRHIDTHAPRVTLEASDCEAIHEALLLSSKEVIPSIDQLKHWLAEHGMVVVPVEPSPWQIRMGCHTELGGYAQGNWAGGFECISKLYTAMVKAARRKPNDLSGDNRSHRQDPDHDAGCNGRTDAAGDEHY